jgi:hypothetical protein
MIPEDQYIFIVPDEDIKPHWIPLLEQACNCIVNYEDMNPGMDFMIQATSSKPEFGDKKSVFFEEVCCLYSYKVELVRGESFKGPFSKVYISNFAL